MNFSTFSFECMHLNDGVPTVISLLRFRSPPRGQSFLARFFVSTVSGSSAFLHSLSKASIWTELMKRSLRLIFYTLLPLLLNRGTDNRTKRVAPRLSSLLIVRL